MDHTIILRNTRGLYIVIQLGCGLWINNFTVQKCVRKILITQQQQVVLKITKGQNNRGIYSFPYMQNHYKFVFSLETLLI